MMFWENIRMALISLKSAKLRSLLTMLGVIIGVAAVVSIMAIGNGVKQAVQDQISSVVNASAIAVASGKISVGKSSGAGAATQSLGSSTLTQNDVTAISKLENIVAVAPMSLISGIVTKEGGTPSSSLLIATTPDFAETQTLKFASGRFLTYEDGDQYVAVLGGAAKTDLFGEEESIGKTILIRGQKFTVVGALKSTDAAASQFSAGPSLENAVYLPTAAAIKLTSSTPPISRIIAQVDDANNVNSTAESMRNALMATHGGQDDFSVLTQKDILATVDSILNLLTTFIAAIAAISLLVGGIGIMNIMLVSVTERTREIGLRKAIGATSGTVLSQFLIEAVTISLIGGALGIGAAIILANVIGGLAGITPEFTPQSIFLAVGVSAAVGIVFGIAPAIKASRLRPIEALQSV